MDKEKRHKIVWTQATWNPAVGCVKISEGCRNCYAEKMACRLAAMGNVNYQRVINWTSDVSGLDYPGHARKAAGDCKGHWNGQAVFVPSALKIPLKMRSPRDIFTGSMTDLFHETLSFEQIAAVFGAMMLCPQHTFQILTKRPERRRRFFEWLGRGIVGNDYKETQERFGVTDPAFICLDHFIYYAESRGFKPYFDKPISKSWPLPHVWQGITAENQEMLNKRWYDTACTPAALRFISYEPAIGALDTENVRFAYEDQQWRVNILTGQAWCENSTSPSAYVEDQPKADWIICGGESGACARAMDYRWAWDIQEQCERNKTPFMFKQWGRHLPAGQLDADGNMRLPLTAAPKVMALGKKQAGRFLDGLVFNDIPERLAR